MKRPDGMRRLLVRAAGSVGLVRYSNGFKDRCGHNRAFTSQHVQAWARAGVRIPRRLRWLLRSSFYAVLALLAVACGSPPQMDVVDVLYYDPANVYGESLEVAQAAVTEWAEQSGVVEITLKPGRPEDGHFLRTVRAERLPCNGNQVLGCQDTNPANGDAVRIRWSSHPSRSREWQIDTLMHEIGHALSGDYEHADEGLMCEDTPHDSAMLGIVDRGLLERIFGSHGLQIDVSTTPEGIPCAMQQH